MAKGKQTFSKSEREKKRRKEKIDKEERRLERKSQNKKGRSFEEMIAYVDENGQFSSTPPDRSKSEGIKLEDIQISISRTTESDEESNLHTGTVTFFNESKSYGFIKESGTNQSLFVHISQVDHILREGEKVTFKIEKTERGLAAVEVRSQ